MDNKLPTKTITIENIEEIYEYIFAPYVKQLKLSFLKIEEGRVIAKLKNSLDSNFEKAIKKIIKCKSKVIICGVGKSGIIASKISATLSSVGTPSFTVSANDCSHGDLGRITRNDILILISNSGETNELKNIIQFANRNKILLIGIVSQKNSVLYRSADIKLLIPWLDWAYYKSLKDLDI